MNGDGLVRRSGKTLRNPERLLLGFPSSVLIPAIRMLTAVPAGALRLEKSPVSVPKAIPCHKRAGLGKR